MEFEIKDVWTIKLLQFRKKQSNNHKSSFLVIGKKTDSHQPNF